MDSWIAHSDRFAAANPRLTLGGADGLYEGVVGPCDDLATPAVLDAYRACEPADASQLRSMLRDSRHRQFVKLLALATETVPEVLFEDFLRAGVETDNPSFNKHFLFPLTILYGRRRVLTSLLEMTTESTELACEKIEAALYWLSIPREQTYWPHRYKRPVDRPPVDEPIDDLLRRFVSVLRDRRMM